MNVLNMCNYNHDDCNNHFMQVYTKNDSEDTYITEGWIYRLLLAKVGFLPGE